jgi:AAA+ superfamily predicted ATPase
MNNSNSLEDLLEIRRETEAMLSLSPDLMKQFVDLDNPDKGFADLIPDNSVKPHLATTAQCLRVVLESGYLGSLRSRLDDEKVWRFFSENKWESSGIQEHNVYVDPLVLEVAHRLDKTRRETKVDQAVKKTVETFDIFLETGTEEDLRLVCTHGFILYWALRALSLYRTELEPIENETVRKMVEYAQSCLFKQLALYYSSSTTEFDVVQLAFFLRASIEFGNFPNLRVIEKCIEVIFAEQQPEGTWRLSRPFLHRPEGGDMRCFSVEVVTALLGVPQLTSLLPKYMAKIRTTLDWVEDNLKTRDGCKGWRSDSHRVDGPPEGWSTALVLEFLDALFVCTARCVNTQLLKELGGRMVSPKVTWDDLVDYKNFKRPIKETIIGPVKEGNPPTKTSIVLFGPTGTGKNAAVEAMAYELKWPVIYITADSLLAEGVDGLMKLAKSVFEKLSLVERAVIFLDEFDEFLTARETEKEKFGRFITASMLPWLSKLRENGKVITVVTTNYIENFDVAIRRHGRFDLVLPIGPPEETDRIRLMEKMLPDLPKEQATQLAIAMDRRMTIGEISEFCKDMKNHVRTKDAMGKAMHMLKENLGSLMIDEETMGRFEKNIKLARY